MKLVKGIALALGIFVAAVLIFAATRPDTLHVERSTNMKAPAEKIFPLISDFHNWGSWSPYEKRDPAMKKTYSGAPGGKGAVYEWAGNSDVGSGRMEITDVSAPSRIVIKLDFIAPFEGHNVAEFTMTPSGDATNVTWTMHGPTQYLGKVIGVFLNMDTMIGTDFEAGLANLKAQAER
ncbi:MAG: SRPBCC family protein [Vicinamibacterales bacterium]|nr:SRPBCC family protein [Vicinamibacterales bacterium]